MTKTQLERARQGEVTPHVKAVAELEGFDPERRELEKQAAMRDAICDGTI